MTATISSYSFSQLTDLIQRSFDDGLKTLPQTMRKSGFVVETAIPEHTGDTKRFAERIHTSQYAPTRDEWDTSEQSKVQYGYEKDWQVHTISLAVSITKRMRVAGKDQAMLDKITSLREVCPNTIDLDLAHRLTFATSTSYTDLAGNSIDITVWDGKALVDSGHTLTGSGTTYSNVITANPTFSKSALETAEKSFIEGSFDNLGKKMVVTPDTIVTTDDPNTVNQVRELLKATADLDSDNSNTFNVYANKYKHVVVPRIATTATGAVDSSKAKYWALVSSRTSDLHLGMLESPYLKTPKDGNNGEDFLSENWNYLAGATYFIATVSWRWIRFSDGSGS